MRVTMFYAPYPGQSFRDEDTTISPVRVRNPKSALVTLAAGARAYLREWGVDAEFKLVDTQVGEGEPELYASFRYGPRVIDCHRYGGPFGAYADEARAADIIGISNNFTNSQAGKPKRVGRRRRDGRHRPPGVVPGQRLRRGGPT
jgi:hypothetical protein